MTRQNAIAGLAALWVAACGSSSSSTGTSAPPKDQNGGNSNLLPFGTPTTSTEGTQCLDLDPRAFQVAFANDLLLIQNGQGVSLLRTNDWSVARTFSVHRGNYAGAAISRDGTHAASIDSDGKLRLFSTADGQEVAVAAVSKQPTIVAFSADGTAVFVADPAGTATLVRWADGGTLWQKTGFGGVTGAAASPDGTVIAVVTSSATELVQTADGSVRNQIANGGSAIAFAPDASFLAIANGTQIVLLSPSDGHAMGSPITATNAIHDVAISPDGTLIAAAADDAHVPIFRRSDGTLAQDLKLTAATNSASQTSVTAFRSVAFSSDGAELAAAEQRLHVWRLSDGMALVQPDALETGMIYGQSVAPTGSDVAFARVGAPAQIWDYAAGAFKQVLPGVESGNQGTVAFDPDDELLVDIETFRAGPASSSLEQGTYWRVGETAPSRTVAYATSEQPDRGGNLVFSPDGKTLAGPGSSTEPGLLRFWSPVDGSLTGSISAFANSMGPIAWSRDGTLIAAAGADHIDTSQTISRPQDESIRIYNVNTQQLSASLSGLTDSVTGLAFLADGQHVVSSDNSGLVRLWGVDGSTTRDLPSNIDGAGAISLSPAGDLVAIRSILWDTYGHNGAISVRRTADLTEAGRFFLYGDGNVGAMSWSPDGTYLFAGSASGVHLFCVNQMAPPAADSDAGSPGDSGLPAR